MTQLILLVLAAVWLAVILPPMLRSRVENRPNSSVTDFRRQLTRLQNTATPPRGAARAMGRPLAQSPLSRPVAAGRPPLRSGLTRRPTQAELAMEATSGATLQAPARYADPSSEVSRFRTHGDPTDPQRRPAMARPNAAARFDRTDGRQRPVHREQSGPRIHGDPTGDQRRPIDPTGEIKRRRSNILFFLVVSTACTLFLAATMSSDVMLYLFVASFLSLAAYVYLLAQQNGQRLGTTAADGWAESY